VFKEFKKFAMRGNVMDMAIGIIIGAAFGAIVGSFVADVLMPPLGVLLGNADFSNMFVVLKDGAAAAAPYASLAEAKEAGAVTLNYGMFINTIINFLIIAIAVFIVVRALNKMKTKEEPAAPTTKDCPYCFYKLALNATRCAFCTSELPKE
jgi:large conductance mechanosensitive channel